MDGQDPVLDRGADCGCEIGLDCECLQLAEVESTEACFRAAGSDPVNGVTRVGGLSLEEEAAGFGPEQVEAITGRLVLVRVDQVKVDASLFDEPG